MCRFHSNADQHDKRVVGKEHATWFDTYLAIQAAAAEDDRGAA